MALARKTKKDAIRELTESELLTVARIAATGNRPAAINRYLEYAVPLALADKYDDPNEVINDPSMRMFMDLVCEFVWLHSRLDASDSNDWQDFKSQFIGSRPVSCAALDFAWESFTNKRNRLVFAEPLRDKVEAPVVPASLDDLSDEEIAETYKNVARAHSQGWPGGRGFTEAEAVAVHA